MIFLGAVGIGGHSAEEIVTQKPSGCLVIRWVESAFGNRWSGLRKAILGGEAGCLTSPACVYARQEIGMASARCFLSPDGMGILATVGEAHAGRVAAIEG